MAVDVESQVQQQSELGGKLAGLSLTQQVVALSIWPLLEQFLSFLVGTVDLALAGRLTPEPLAVDAADALGVAGYVAWLMGLVHASVGVGASALIARAVGGRHKRLANAALGQALILALASGLAIGLGVWGLAAPVGKWCGLDGPSLELCRSYLRIVVLAAPTGALLLVGNAALRGAGDTRSPFVVMVAVNVLNMVLSALLVFGPEPFGGHGVAGIAMGTAAAWAMGAVMTLTVLARGWGTPDIRLRLHRLRPHWHTLGRIVKVGLPNLFESTVGMWLGNFLGLIIVGSLSIPGVVGAHMIAIRIEAASYLLGFALAIAAATLSGQYLGLGDAQRARRAVSLCWAMGAAIMGIMGVLFLTIPGVLVRLITDAGPLIDQSVMPIRICSPIQIFLATQMILAGAMRGAGDTRTTMMITTLMTLFVRVPAMYVAGIVLGYGLNGIWVAMSIEIIIRALIFAWRFFHGGWVKVDV